MFIYCPNNGEKRFYIAAPMVEGPILRLYKVSRLDMGAYMCIASNGIPPAVSKRIHLGIDCEIFKLFSPDKMLFKNVSLLATKTRNHG